MRDTDEGRNCKGQDKGEGKYLQVNIDICKKATETMIKLART